MVSQPGFALPAYVRFLALHGIEPTACDTTTLAAAGAECSLALLGMAP